MKELFFETIDSTNSYLKDHYRDLDDMTFVSADYQSEGKGRGSRKWLSDKGANLMFSFLVKDEEVMKRYPELSLLCAFSVLEVLNSFGISDLMIKWPNDVYVKDAKICGILLEGISHEKPDCIVCGIGINVNQTDFEEEFATEAVSMRMLLKENVEIGELRKKVYRKINENIEQLKRGYDFHKQIDAYDYLRGKTAYALIGNERKQVDILGIDHDCSLKVRDGNSIMNLNSSEITFHL